MTLTWKMERIPGPYHIYWRCVTFSANKDVFNSRKQPDNNIQTLY